MQTTKKIEKALEKLEKESAFRSRRKDINSSKSLMIFFLSHIVYLILNPIKSEQAIKLE